MAIKSPCFECLQREIPKTCELHCERWKEYKKQHEEEKKTNYKNKLFLKIKYGGYYTYE